VEALLFTMPLVFLLFIVEQIASRSRNFSFLEFMSNIVNGLGTLVSDLFFLPALSGLYLVIESNHFYQVPQNLLTAFGLLVMLDFLWYGYHRLAHKLNFLWALHEVHHQAEYFNISVGLRDSWLHRLGTWTIYLIPALLGVPLSFYLSVLGVHIGYSYLTHTNFVKKTPKWFSAVFVTPSFHRAHHGKNPEYIDKNFGLMFSFWDRLFGTCVDEEAEVIFGVNRALKTFNPLKNCAHHWLRFNKGETFFIYPGLVKGNRFTFMILIFIFAMVTLFLAMISPLIVKIIFASVTFLFLSIVGDLADIRK
jgi:alkylglycerol monooxygenase